MRISDWSSDVCSSDWPLRKARTPAHPPPAGTRPVLCGTARAVPGRRFLPMGGRVLQILDHGQSAHDRRDRCCQHSGRTAARSEEHTSELQSLMRISYAVFGLNKKTKTVKRYNIPEY